ncbi:hypothetical protein [Tenacibaculum sp. nBUS_03]|uniref:hypothetical protein n=1 Tax=Tenacibaculum sp. nBUS_03 TaxID=3395320 RepID=UPI003EC153FB
MAKVLKTTIDPTVIKIPMRSYLVKYLTKLYGKEYKVTKRTYLGLIIVDVLTKDYQKPIFTNEKSTYNCIVANQLCVTHGHFPKYTSFSVLEKKIDNIFKTSMYEFVRINLQTGKYDQSSEIIKCLGAFLEFYNINEDDLNLETAYKNYSRYVSKKRNSDKKKT